MTYDQIKSLIPAYLLHSQTYSLVVTDLEGKYSFVNELFANRFSFMCDDFIGQPSFIAIYPEDHTVCLQAVEQCLANPGQVVKVELRKPDTSEGDFYWTRWEFSLFFDQDHQVAGILCLGHDISESEKASRQAREFAHKVDTVLEEITDGFYQLDQQWNFVKINRRARQLLGVELPGVEELDTKGLSTNGLSNDGRVADGQDLVGQCFWDLFADTAEYSYPARFRKAMQEKITVSFEEYHTELDKWFATRAYPSSEGLTVFFSDVTAEHKARLQLQASENKLKAILDSTTDSNLLISRDGKLLNFNKAAQQSFLQYYQKQLYIGGPVREFLPPESRQLFDRCFPKALKGHSLRAEVKRKVTDQMRWFEVWYMPVYDGEQKLIGVAKNTRNIDEKKEAEQKIAQQEYILSAIYESSREASSFIDRNLIIRYNNQVAKQVTQQIFGIAAQAGDYSLDFVLPRYKAEFKRYYKRVLKGEHIVVERSEGSRWWQLSMHPVLDQGKRVVGIAHNVQNITEQKEREVQLLRQNQTLRAIYWQHSHEFRRPVANILGLCDLLNSNIDQTKQGDTGPKATEQVRNNYIKLMIEQALELDSLLQRIVEQAVIGSANAELATTSMASVSVAAAKQSG